MTGGPKLAGPLATHILIWNIQGHGAVRTNFVKDIFCSAQVFLQLVASMSFQLPKPCHSMVLHRGRWWGVSWIMCSNYSGRLRARPELVSFSSAIISLLCVWLFVSSQMEIEKLKQTVHSTWSQRSNQRQASRSAAGLSTNQGVGGRWSGGLNERMEGGWGIRWTTSSTILFQWSRKKINSPHLCKISILHI